MAYLAVDKVKVEIRVLEEGDWRQVLGNFGRKALQFDIQHSNIALCPVVARLPYKVSKGKPRGQVFFNVGPVATLLAV